MVRRTRAIFSFPGYFIVQDCKRAHGPAQFISFDMGTGGPAEGLNKCHVERTVVLESKPRRWLLRRGFDVCDSVDLKDDAAMQETSSAR
jgi:hypothetical protein